MLSVHLRSVTAGTVAECLQLRVADAQRSLVATNVQSLAEAYANPALHPLAIYDAAARGYEHPPVPMIGFAMYEVTAGIGFIQRLMIDRAYQGRGYGRAALVALIRRLRLHPDVEEIATSHRRENVIAARLYARLGFVPWTIGWVQPEGEEVFLCLPGGG